ncbi:Smr/MutS family protein [Candidatus Pelagibacter sp.]|nr:Smr/MutS family protein [Candidatus Pelagibacter sp.]MDA9728021.1 Smr/MutS family protein [Candidatus Pelagibacter sp.]
MTNKLSDKDKKDWKNFIESSEKLDNKDIDNLDQLNVSEKIIDLHGYSLDEANKKIENFIESCYSKKIKKINVITGKGMRSKNLEDPYQSIDMSILKYSVPEYIKNNNELMKKIIRIDFDSVNSPSKGSFDIFLKSIK